MSIHIAMIHCRCGKLHATAGMGPDSLCTCGDRLWPQVWVAPHAAPTSPDTDEEQAHE